MLLYMAEFAPKIYIVHDLIGLFRPGGASDSATDRKGTPSTVLKYKPLTTCILHIKYMIKP